MALHILIHRVKAMPTNPDVGVGLFTNPMTTPDFVGLVHKF